MKIASQGENILKVVEVELHIRTGNKTCGYLRVGMWSVMCNPDVAVLYIAVFCCVMLYHVLCCVAGCGVICLSGVVLCVTVQYMCLVDKGVCV